MKPNKVRAVLSGAIALVTMAMAGSLYAQLRDKTQITPIVPGGAINKSWMDEIGAGRGDIMTPNTSAFIIARDPFRAVRRGREIFQRKFQMKQGMGPTTNDGETNVSYVGGDRSGAAGLADSCASCLALARDRATTAPDRRPAR